MKSLFLSLLPFFLVFSAEAKQAKSSFGAQISTKKSLDLETVIANYKDYKGKKVVVSGKVKKVCEKKGCWMSVESGKAQVRTLFKDYGFFVPKEIMGKVVKLEGQLVQKTLKPAEVRHFMKDEGQPASAVKKIKKSKTVFQFVAEGVQILGT